MIEENIRDTQHREDRTWNGFNNIGICSTAIGAILNNVNSLSLAKTLLIMPLVMHDATLRFLAKGNVRERQVAAFASMNPEFVANFNKRYQDSLILSLNSIQFLISLGYVRYDGELTLINKFSIDDDFGKQALLIERSAKNMSALLGSSEGELYLNLRVKL